jgi:hypothetical protein
MDKHPITVAFENVDPELLATSLAEDVVFHSPVLATVGNEVHGRDVVARILATAIMGFGAPKDVTEFTAPDGRYVIAFNGDIDGHALQGAILVTENSAGEVDSVSPHLRPYPIVTAFREHMKAYLCPDPIPDYIWELPATV